MTDEELVERVSRRTTQILREEGLVARDLLPETVSAAGHIQHHVFLKEVDEALAALRKGFWSRVGGTLLLLLASVVAAGIWLSGKMAGR